MEALRRRWWVALLGVLVLAGVIVALAPHYTQAQTAKDVDAFRLAVGDPGPGRTQAAAVADMAFVVAYVTLAVALTRRHVASKVGVALLGVGAVADMVENALVFVAAGRLDDVTEGTVDTIGSFGAIKWAGVILGALALLAGLVLTPKGDDGG